MREFSDYMRRGTETMEDTHADWTWRPLEEHGYSSAVGTLSFCPFPTALLFGCIEIEGCPSRTGRAASKLASFFLMLAYSSSSPTFLSLSPTVPQMGI
jgi:hypothetical protein